jgi:hypothetical protein
MEQNNIEEHNNSSPTENLPTETEQTNTSILQESVNKFNEAIADFERNLPKDDLEALTGIQAGSKEHASISELVDRVKDNNSTSKFLFATTWFSMIGWIAIAISFVFKAFGVVFDMDYHFPMVKELVGWWLVVAIGILMATIIKAVTHLSADALVNNKWRKIPKLIAVTFFLLGFASSIYFYQRAIFNYSNIMAEKFKDKELQKLNNADAVRLKAVREEIEAVKKMSEGDTKRLESLNNQIDALTAQKASINKEISQYKKRKEGRISRREEKKLNSNIYTSRKQKDSIDRDIERLLKQTNSLRNDSSSSTSSRLAILAEKEKKILDEVQAKIDEQKGDQVVFRWIFVLFFELLSYIGIVAKVMENLNRHRGISMEAIDRINAMTSDEAIVKAHMRQLQAQKLKEMNQDFAIMRGSTGLIGQLGTTQVMNQAQTTKDIVDTVVVTQSEMANIGRQAVGTQIEMLQLRNKMAQHGIEE